MHYRAFFHSRQFRYLGSFYLHSIIRLFAVSIFQIFSGIYIYQVLGDFGVSSQQALAFTTLYFCLVFLVHALSIAPALWLITKKGLKFSILWGNIFLIFYFILLYFAKFDPIFLIISGVLGGLQIGLYWTAYHIFFTELSDDTHQGEEIALSFALPAIAAVGGPAFGGLIISYVGFPAVFLAMTTLVILASLPLRYLPKQKDTILVNILQITKSLVPKKEVKTFLSLLATGTLDMISSVFWPIFVFSILAGFVGVGFMGSLSALIATLTTVIIGFLIDKFGAKKVLNILSSLDSLIWVLKTLVLKPWHVFAISGASALTINGQFVSVDALVYKRARHNNLVAIIIQREVGLALGKFIFLFIIGILFWFGIPLVAIFIITAILSLLTRLYPQE